MFGPVLLGLTLAAAPTRIAVLEVSVGGGADPTMKEQITARIAEVVSQREGVEVIAPDDIRAVLEKEAEKQLMGCDDESCLAEIGGALGADVLIKGRVSKLDTGYGFSLSSVDATTAKPIGKAAETWGGASIGLLELVVPMVDRIFAEKGAPLLGSVEVTAAPDGAQILIDDQVRGTSPAGQMGQVEIGARRVQVVLEDHAPFEQWIVVKRGRVTTVVAQLTALESEPFYATWWFWTLTGGAVVGGAVAAAVVLTTGSDDVPPGATGVNVSVNSDAAFMGGP